MPMVFAALRAIANARKALHSTKRFLPTLNEVHSRAGVTTSYTGYVSVHPGAQRDSFIVVGLRWAERRRLGKMRPEKSRKDLQNQTLDRAVFSGRLCVC